MIHATWTRRVAKWLFSSAARKRSSTGGARLLLEVLEDRRVPAVWLVTNGTVAGDGLAYSLRWAIRLVNAGGGGDTIDFAIGPVGAVGTVHLDPTQGALPALMKSATVNGYSQGGPGVAGSPWVEIDGTTPGGQMAGDGGPIPQKGAMRNGGG